MYETKLLNVLIIGWFVIGIAVAVPDQDSGTTDGNIATAGFEGDLVIDRYDAVLDQDGTLTERYIYDVKNSGQYRMLYRTWEAPLTLEAVSEPYVRFVSLDVPTGSIGYIKDNQGRVTTPLEQGDVPEKETIRDLAEDNEAGIFNADHFNAGTYTVSYTYVLHPPVAYNDYNTYLTLRLAGNRHIPYRDVRISLPSEHIDTVYAYPETLSVSRGGSDYLVTGSLAENEALVIEMVGDSGAFSGIPAFRSRLDAMEGKTEPAAIGTTSGFIPPAAAFSVVNVLAIVSVFAIPLILFWIYRRYGREEEFSVPFSRGSVPNTGLKPWQVNLLFKNDRITFDRNGFYATLLDLHRRKLIALIKKPEGTGFRIRIFKTTSPDPYEQRVLDFLITVSEAGVLDSSRIEKLVESARTDSSAKSLVLNYQRKLKDVTSRVDSPLRREYIVDGRGYIVPLLFYSIILLAASGIIVFLHPAQGEFLIPAIVFSTIAFGETIIAIAMPPTFFGHWKDDRYREKLEWDAFARALSDDEIMNSSTTSDTSVWSDRLVYGTALGVGHNVEKAMQARNISGSDTGIPPVDITGLSAAFLLLIHFTPPSDGWGNDSGDSDGYSGGDFGGGGGFGGGGAGGR